MNLRGKLLLCVLGPAVAAVALGSMAFSRYSSHVEIRQAQAALLSTAETFGGEIDTHFRLAEGDLDILLTSGSIRDYFMFASLGLLDPAEDFRGKVERFFLRATQSKREYATLRLIGLDGVSVINIIDRKVSYRHFDFSAEEWFEKALELEGERAFFAPVHICREHKKPGTFVAKAYRNEVGEIQGVASLHVHVQDFFHGLLEWRFGQEGHAYLINDAGIVVAHPDPARIGLSVADSASTRALLAGKRGAVVEADESDGTTMLKAYLPLEIKGLSLVVVRPMSEVMAAGKHFRLLGLLVVCFPPLLVGVVIYLFWHRFTAPLSALQRGVQIVATGNLDHRTALSRGDEFGLFSRAFDDMVQRLQDTLASRDELNREINERRRAEHLLRQFKTTLDKVLDCIFIFDPETLRFTYANAGAVEQVGYGREELLALTPVDVKPEFDEPSFRKIAQSIVASPSKSKIFRTTHQHKDGKRFPVEIFLQYIDLDGGENHFVAVVRDISERVKIERELQLMASVFSHANEGIAITDPEANILDVNEAFTQITGYHRSEVQGKNPSLLQSGRHDAEFYQTMWRQLTEQGHWVGKIWNRRKNSEIYVERLSINAVNDERGRVHHYVGIFSDITHQVTHEQQMEHLAHYDALTNLPNRVLLADRLQQAMAQVKRRNRQLAVIYLDLDGFKEINDSHGHDIGDQLLVTLSSRLGEALRDGDTAARLGGDEFAAVLMDLSSDTDCVPLLERLLGTTSLPVHVGDLILHVSASLGVTFYPQEESINADQLLRQADQAMYQAKLAGKNCYQLFDAELDRTVRGYHETVERVRQALSEQEFILYYQPKVNMRTGEVLGAEALVRWQHPQKGLLSPAQFLPVTENHLLSIELDTWVIGTALEQLVRWHRQGLKLSVSVNICPYNIQQPDFMERFKAQLEAFSEVDACFLELEVLESSALDDLAHVSDVINACAEMGVSFALDDFGTGYSSLTYLKQLPASVLKIDRSFVKETLDDSDSLAILEGIIGLANAFRRQVIAEGVETIEHGRLLLQLGCELGQGYGIARPMPSAALPGWVAQWKPCSKWVRQRPIKRDDHALLFAARDHRTWLKGVAAFLRGESDTLPPLSPDQCRLGRWLNDEGRERYGPLPAFEGILSLHERVHRIGMELCDLRRNGRETLEGLPPLYESSNALLEQLERLLAEDL